MLKLIDLIFISFLSAFIIAYTATNAADEASLKNSQYQDDLSNFAAPTELSYHNRSMAWQNNEQLEVIKIQVRLQELGYDCGGLDGLIGPKTEQAIKAFQRDQKLVVDGIVGPITAKALIFIK